MPKDILGRLKQISRKALQKNRHERALAAIEACANILYAHNQVYTDDELEELARIAGEQIMGKIKPGMVRERGAQNGSTILFYDGFGLDTRGLALIFLKGLVRCGYRVVYVTKKSALNQQPEIDKAVQGYDFRRIYIEMNHTYLIWMKELAAVFEECRSTTAFFYSTPFDVAGAVVFGHYEGAVARYLIDLTDHAYWLGRYSCDYFVELRDVGAKIAYHYRKIPKEKLLMLPYYADINPQIEFQGFPFETKGYRVIFSGGALYKTLGDKENKYYRIIEEILGRHKDIIFLYAGYGDDSQLKRMIYKYPDRVYHIGERKDLYQVMRRCVLYLNTYPMFGGVMMHYAALAGKLPLTLKHNHDADGLLFNQSSLGIEYDNMDELINDVDRLLKDETYLREREDKLKGCVISEKLFERNLKQLIEERSTDFTISAEYIDTREFREEYDQRFRYEEAARTAIASRINRVLFFFFPYYFMQWLGRHFRERIRYRKGNDTPE